MELIVGRVPKDSWCSCWAVGGFGKRHLALWGHVQGAGLRTEAAGVMAGHGGDIAPGRESCGGPGKTFMSCRS